MSLVMSVEGMMTFRGSWSASFVSTHIVILIVILGSAGISPLRRSGIVPVARSCSETDIKMRNSKMQMIKKLHYWKRLIIKIMRNWKRLMIRVTYNWKK